MADVEKQEGQKTVVAFIAGLLIGGLLVWVFSSSPEQTPVEEGTGTDTEEVTSNGSDTTDSTSESDDDMTRTTDNDTTDTMTGPGSLDVSNQEAGNVVVLDGITYPQSAGWIAVRDYADGVPGNILGAARYNEEEGLMPEAVSLLRATVPGMEYQVVFYTENGDRVFDLEDDVLVEGIATTFTAHADKE